MKQTKMDDQLNGQLPTRQFKYELKFDRNNFPHSGLSHFMILRYSQPALEKTSVKREWTTNIVKS